MKKEKNFHSLKSQKTSSNNVLQLEIQHPRKLPTISTQAVTFETSSNQIEAGADFHLLSVSDHVVGRDQDAAAHRLVLRVRREPGKQDRMLNKSHSSLRQQFLATEPTV